MAEAFDEKVQSSMNTGHVGDGDTSPIPENHPGREDDTELVTKFREKKTNIRSTLCLPMNTPWTFWVDRTKRGMGAERFEASLRLIHTSSTVQGFWEAFRNIPAPSTLDQDCGLHLSRYERKPIWEEEHNCRGGTFRLRVNKKDTDKIWRELLMAAVGEQLNEYVSTSDEICGVSVSIRDCNDIFFIWNKLASEARNARVFESVHVLLPGTVFLSEFYKSHASRYDFAKSEVMK